MIPHVSFGAQLALFLSFIISIFSNTYGQVVISEVASRGTSNVCSGEDWTELYNPTTEAVDLSAYRLHDDKGILADDTFTFPFGSSIAANSYLLLCHDLDIFAPNGTLSPQFGIGSDDTVTLVRVEGVTVQVLSQVGPLPNVPIEDGAENLLSSLEITYALDFETGTYNFTSTPTPGAANEMTFIPTRAEIIAQIKGDLAAQSQQGEAFFNFDLNGDPVADGMDAILDLKITMPPNDYDALVGNPQWEEYLNFQTAEVLTTGPNAESLLTLNQPGRIRTRGSDAIFMAKCTDSPLPFRLDFDSEVETQTLFGVKRIFLRHNVLDNSNMRDWAYHRMLARFGLPHARTRMVHFYINDEWQGFYTLMEVPEQEYVFARNFPDYNPGNFALFQTAPGTKHCGEYPQELLEQAYARVDEPRTPPYEFERGNHVAPFEATGNLEECRSLFDEYFNGSLLSDAALAYVRNDEDCAAMLVGEGLVDQELGTDNWDNEIENFIQQVMGFGKRCSAPGCTRTTLPQEVDTTNFLKTFAFLAVVLDIDSLMGNVNNHYLAQEESDLELWKLVVYDFGNPFPTACGSPVCVERMVSWSIARPTCYSLEANPLVGPLLADEGLHSEYLGYVREFLDSVYANSTVIAEIEAQAEAIQSAVGDDSSFEVELTPVADNWNSDTIPLLPTMAARAASLQEQLSAIESGSFPRGPHVGTNGDNLAWEVCANWRLSEPVTAACEEGCQYEYCSISGWAVESFCDEVTGICYHGEEDQQCIGIADGDYYPGSSSAEGVRRPFCWYGKGMPVRAIECLAPGEVPADLVQASNGSAVSAATSANNGSFVTMISSCLFAVTSSMLLFAIIV